MNIYLDNVIFYLQNFGGISVYWNELVKNILSHQEWGVKFINPSVCQPHFKEAVVIPEKLIISDKKLPLGILRYLPINSKIFTDGCVLHSSYFRFSRNKKVKNIITVYDFTYERYMHGLVKAVHFWQKKLAIKHAASIICISKNTKRDLLYFYPEVDESKVEVIYLSASESFVKIENLHIASTRFKNLKEKKIISFIGKRVAYKNFKIAVEIIKKMPDDYHLLIVGGGKLNNKEKAALAPCENKYSQVLSVGSDELNIIYNISFCYLYPSEYEGFGIPILEAMRACCPVVCQGVSSIPEVYGNVENLVKNVNNVDEFCTNIRKLENLNFRNKLISQGLENAKRFSWRRTAEETVNVYKKITV